MVALDYKKLFSDEHVTVWIGPNGTITDLHVPTAAQLNTDMVMASPSISWNNTEVVGVAASEEINEPSLADPASYVEFGPSGVEGSMSYFMPREYDDNSNLHSTVYDLTDTMRETLDFAVRIDGEKKTSLAAANGDYVSTSRAMAMSEEKAHTVSESITRTVNYSGQGDFAHYTIVGPHTLTATAPSGTSGRITVEVGGRDYTNACRFSTTDTGLRVLPGGFFDGSGEVLVEDEGAGTSTTVVVGA